MTDRDHAREAFDKLHDQPLPGQWHGDHQLSVIRQAIDAAINEALEEAVKKLEDVEEAEYEPGYSRHDLLADQISICQEAIRGMKRGEDE